MADNIRISPQGYVYGEEPLSDHPFWEDGPAGADQYVKEVTGSSTTEGTVTTYDIKYKDQDDVSHDVIAIPVDSAGGGSNVPSPPSSVIGEMTLIPSVAYRMGSSVTSMGNSYYKTNGTPIPSFEQYATISVTPISENKCLVEVNISVPRGLRNSIASAFGLLESGALNQYGDTVLKASALCEYSKTGSSGELHLNVPFILPFMAKISNSSASVATWIGYFSVTGTYSLGWIE